MLTPEIHSEKLLDKIGHFAIEHLLLNSNADVHTPDYYINTPIHIAVMNNYYKLIKPLMECWDASGLWQYGKSLVAKFGCTSVVQLFIKHGQNADVTNLDGSTPLHLAFDNCHFEVIEVLLRNKADAKLIFATLHEKRLFISLLKSTTCQLRLLLEMFL